MEQHDRIRRARQMAGFSSAADAARRLGVPYGTYAGHENGQRQAGMDDVARYARAFRVSLTWLAFGAEEPLKRTDVAISGTVKNGGEVVMSPSKSKEKVGLDFVHIDIIPPDSSKCFLIADSSLLPSYAAGDIIICLKDRRDELKSYSGERCVVQTVDGNYFFCELRHIRDEKLDIILFGKEPLIDASVSWIGELVAHIPYKATQRSVRELAHTTIEVINRASQKIELLDKQIAKAERAMRNEK